MQASEVNLTPVRGSNMDNINIHSVCSELLGDYTASDPYEFNGRLTTAVTGRCLRLDMDNEEDRAKYADLVAVAAVDGGHKISIVWEEHVKTADGGLLIYVCYTELGKVASKFIEGANNE